MSILDTFQNYQPQSPILRTAPPSAPSNYALGDQIVNSPGGRGQGIAGSGAPNQVGGLTNTFMAGIEDERKRRMQLANQEDQSGAGVDSAISGLEGQKSTNIDAYDPTNTRNFNPTNTQNFDPSATKGVDLSGVEHFDPSAQRGVNFDALSGVDLSGVKNFQNKNLDGADVSGALDTYAKTGGATGPSALSGFKAQGFDAGGAVKDYATGAASDFFRNQKVALSSLGSAAVGAGRLNTGFFDKDQGDVITELGRGFTSDIAKQAVAAAGITAQSHSAADATNERAGEGIDQNSQAGASRSLSALGQSAQLKFNKANAQDSNLLDAAKSGANMDITKGTNLGNLSLSRASGIDQSRQKAVTDAASLGLQKGSTIDSLSLNKDQYLDTSGQAKAGALDSIGLDKAKYQDTFQQTNKTNALGARQARTNQLSSDQNQSSNRYLDALTGGINLLQGQQNAKDQKKSSFLGGLFSAAGGIGGFLLGGPAGAAVGSKAGGALGSGIS